MTDELTREKISEMARMAREASARIKCEVCGKPGVTLTPDYLFGAGNVFVHRACAENEEQWVRVDETNKA